MGESIRGHIRSNVIGYVALFVALSGTAYATHPGGTNTISTDDIINGEVREPDILNGAVTGADINNTNGVRSEDVRDDTLFGGGLSAADLGPDSVAASEVLDNSLTGGDLDESTLFNDDSLTDGDLAAGSVGFSELQFGGVTNPKLATSAVTSSKLGPGSVLNSKIAGDAVTETKIADGAVINATIADNAVTGAKITNGTVGQNDIGASAVDASELGAISERTVDFAVPENEFATATVSCAVGEQVISGGYDFSFPTVIVVTEFRRSGNGWRLTAFNRGGAGDLGGTSVYAYCLNPGS
jgi:hypothetical protein